MTCLEQRVKRSFEYDNGLDIMRKLEYADFEDREGFDGASDAVVREHFKSWIILAPQEEQGTTAGCFQRYRFVL